MAVAEEVETVDVEKDTQAESSKSLEILPTETVNDLEKTIENLKANQRLDKETLNSLKENLKTYGDLQVEYAKANVDVVALEREVNRLHFGIGAGIEYHQPKNFGISIDGSLRWKSLMLVTGITYYPINDGNVTDKSRVGGHASILYEF